MLRRTGVVKIFGIMLLLGINVMGINAQTLTIDEAISGAVNEMVNRVPSGTKIAVVNFNAPSAELADYVINELIYKLVNTYKFQVVPRNEVELQIARNELDFQYTGDVSDESQQSLGQFLGASTIVSGSLVREGNNIYRIRINVIITENLSYQAVYSQNIRNDSKIRNLLASSGGNNTTGVGGKIGFGALNLFLGLGAYIQGDIGSGIIMSVADGLGIGLIIWEITGFEYDDKGAGIPGFIGLLSIGGSAVYGFVQPFIYRKNPGLANIVGNLQIGLLPTRDGTAAVSLSWRKQF